MVRIPCDAIMHKIYSNKEIRKSIDKCNSNPFFSGTLDQVLAMFSYTAQNSDELTFCKGSVINVLNREGDWWQGELNGQVGVFPNNYIQPLDDLPTMQQCK